jgi:hypothetical protein
VFGSVVGGVIAVAAPRVKRRGLQQHNGLEAFQGAPCWEYDHAAAAEPARAEAEAADQPSATG